MSDARYTLRRIESAGYKVCVFELPASLLGSRPAMIELQAVELDAGDPHVLVVSVNAAEDRALERAAELLAEQVERLPHKS